MPIVQLKLLQICFIYLSVISQQFKRQHYSIEDNHNHILYKSLLIKHLQASRGQNCMANQKHSHFFSVFVKIIFFIILNKNYTCI